jgi:hypothetical protein
VGQTRLACEFTEQSILKFSDATIAALSNRCEGEAIPSPHRYPARNEQVFGLSPPGHHCLGVKTEPTRGRYAMSLETKPATGASIGELMSQLSSQTSRLIRDEMRLAQKEFQESAKHAGIGAGLFSVAGLLAFFGAATFITAAVAALALVMPVWAAALIVGVVLFAAAGIAALVGRNQTQEATPAAPRTVQTVKEDIRELKDARHDRT